jgi:hypothetical protein
MQTAKRGIILDMHARKLYNIDEEVVLIGRCGAGGVVLWSCLVVLSCHLVLVCSCALVLLCSCALVLLCYCALVLVCSCALVLLCSCALVLLSSWLSVVLSCCGAFASFSSFCRCYSIFAFTSALPLLVVSLDVYCARTWA